MTARSWRCCAKQGEPYEQLLLDMCATNRIDLGYANGSGVRKRIVDQASGNHKRRTDQTECQTQNRHVSSCMPRRHNRANSVQHILAIRGITA
jgi:hypothetical protein